MISKSFVPVGDESTPTKEFVEWDYLYILICGGKTHKRLNLNTFQRNDGSDILLWRHCNFRNKDDLFNEMGSCSIWWKPRLFKRTWYVRRIVKSAYCQLSQALDTGSILDEAIKLKRARKEKANEFLKFINSANGYIFKERGIEAAQ